MKSIRASILSLAVLVSLSALACPAGAQEQWRNYGRATGACDPQRTTILSLGTATLGQPLPMLAQWGLEEQPTAYVFLVVGLDRWDVPTGVCGTTLLVLEPAYLGHASGRGLATVTVQLPDEATLRGTYLHFQFFGWIEGNAGCQAPFATDGRAMRMN